MEPDIDTVLLCIDELKPVAKSAHALWYEYARGRLWDKYVQCQKSPLCKFRRDHTVECGAVPE